MDGSSTTASAAGAAGRVRGAGGLSAALFGALLLLGGAAPALRAQGGGKQLFDTYCIACHTIGGGQLVGPDLKGVTERRSREWLVEFIKSSQAMVNRGDADAVALFNQFNKVVMPDAPYTAEQIGEILTYIEGGGSGTAAAAAPEQPMTPADVERGGKLFQGLIRFANGGPACNSCHHVKNDAVIGGGVLAKDLTQVFSSMGGPGVRAILGMPPFPVMEVAYKNHPLQPDEVHALVAFLQDADKNHAFQKPVDYGVRLVVAGSGVYILIAGLYALIWRRRKTLPVNHAIFARQVKSR